MENSKYEILLCLMFFITAIIGYEFCYNECNSSSGQQSLYEQYCCRPSNRGETIKIKEGKFRYFIVCPQEIPSSCTLNRKYLSCSEILSNVPNATSGYYNIDLINGSTVSVYCDMEGVNCDGKGGWTRIAYLNMTEPDATCPYGLVQKNFSNINHDVCGKILVQNNCSSTFFNMNSISYTKVCGQIRGYQFGEFRGKVFNYSATIDNYVSGVSITYYNDSQQREHIWTYASGGSEINIGLDFGDCPCNTDSNTTVPFFVEDDYYCESGIEDIFNNNITGLFPDDPLWDGEQCNYDESPCCTNPDLPWFVKTLNESTNSNIELRICSIEESTENTLIDIAELYVK